MKKTLLFLLSICMIFSSLVFCVSAEDTEEYEEYDGMVCVKGELVVWTNVYVEPVICEDGESVDFFGISVTEIDALFNVENGGPDKWSELTKNKFPYGIKIASDVDIYEARAFLEQQDCVLEVLFNAVIFDAADDDTNDDETETPVSKTVEYTESIFTFENYDEQAMSDLGFEPTYYGKDFQPIVIDSRETIDALSDCGIYAWGRYDPTFDEYFAKYDEAFFEDNALVVVFAQAAHPGYKYEVLSLEYAEDGETLVFSFECKIPLGGWPDVLQYDLIMAEVKKADIADCTSITTEYSEFENIWGDVNGDETVDSLDYLMAKRAAFGTYTLDEEEFERADVYIDRNYEINSADYLLIKRIAFGTYEIW